MTVDDDPTGSPLLESIDRRLDALEAGGAYVDVPISADGADWTNPVPVGWVFNGDGTVTSDGTGGTIALALPALAMTFGLGMRLVVPVVSLDAGGDFTAQLQTDNESQVLGVNYVQDGGLASVRQRVFFLDNDYDDVTTLGDFHASHVFVAHFEGMAAALGVDGVPVATTVHNPSGDVTSSVSPPSLELLSQAGSAGDCVLDLRAMRLAVRAL